MPIRGRVQAAGLAAAVAATGVTGCTGPVSYRCAGHCFPGPARDHGGSGPFSPPPGGRFPGRCRGAEVRAPPAGDQDHPRRSRGRDRRGGHRLHQRRQHPLPPGGLAGPDGGRPGRTGGGPANTCRLCRAGAHPAACGDDQRGRAGARAVAVLAGPDAPGPGATTCPPPYRWLRVTLPRGHPGHSHLGLDSLVRGRAGLRPDRDLARGPGPNRLAGW